MTESTDVLTARLTAGAAIPVPPAERKAPTILVFDSGLGGLTVLAETMRARPDARYIYAADDAAFPYGRLSEAELVARVLTVMGRLMALHHPDLVVIACNTASTLVLPHLRTQFPVPFVGTVPAIKPAALASRTRHISVLATPGTVARDYTIDLVRAYAADCRVTLVGSQRLAALAEAELKGLPAPDAAILAEIGPCFVSTPQGRTDTIVLGCTHYPLLRARLEALAPWPVALIDPAPALARRVVQLAGPPLIGHEPGEDEEGAIALFTSGRQPPAVMTAALAARGLTRIVQEPMPL